VPKNMMAMVGYIKISMKSIPTFEKKSTFGFNAKKEGSYHRLCGYSVLCSGNLMQCGTIQID
jgi:hypothetical protein